MSLTDTRMILYILSFKSDSTHLCRLKHHLLKRAHNYFYENYWAIAWPGKNWQKGPTCSPGSAKGRKEFRNVVRQVLKLRNCGRASREIGITLFADQVNGAALPLDFIRFLAQWLERPIQARHHNPQHHRQEEAFEPSIPSRVHHCGRDLGGWGLELGS